MENGRTVSIGKILWKILRHPLATDLSYDEAAEYAIEIIGLIGAPVTYDDLFAEIEINEFKGLLPNNIVYIKQVRDLESNIALREATNSFHSSDNAGSDTRAEATYEIKRGLIYTSFETGCVEVAYKALPIDEYGYPLIADNPQLKMAIEYYVLSRYLEPLYDIGKISDKAFNRIDQKRHFYVAAAQNNLNMPSIDKMQSLVNSIGRLIVNTTAHKNLFRYAGEQERIKKFE